MADLVLITGDKALFTPSFGAAIVIAQPGNLVGSGKARVGGKPVCVEGDEKKVLVPGCSYFTPQYPIPGVGTLTIDSLGGDQRARKTRTGGKALLLKGSTFTAKFQVMAPAQAPGAPPPPPDSTPQYTGTGTFLTTDFKVRAE